MFLHKLFFCKKILWRTLGNSTHSVLFSQSRKIQEYISWPPNGTHYVFASTSSSNSQHLYSIKFILAQGYGYEGEPF